VITNLDGSISTMKGNLMAPHQNSKTYVLIAFLAVMVLSQAIVIARNTPLGAPPDELAHISYVQDATKPDSFLPDYASGTILNKSNLNYLTHPPLFYSLSGLIAKIFSLDALEDFFAFRVFNAFLVTIGFVLILLGAMSARADSTSLVALSFSTLAVPMFGYLAGSINSDNLLYLGVSLFFFGVLRSQLNPDRFDWVSGSAMSAGLTITLLTKATGGAFLVFFCVLFSLSNWSTAKKLFWRPQRVGFLIFPFVVVSAYYLYSLSTYGQLFPRPGILREFSPPTDPQGILSVTAIFFIGMFERLPMISSHLVVQPFSRFGLVAFYVMFFTPIAVWSIQKTIARRSYTVDDLAKITNTIVLALLATVLVHLYFVYDSYLQNGIFAGIQPRYYFYVLPVLWFLMLQTRERKLRFFGVSVFLFSAGVAFWSSSPTVLLKQAQAGMEQAIKNDKIARGHIDRFEIRDHKAVINGWALDQHLDRGAKRVLALFDGQHLGAAVPSRNRLDVARHFGNQEAASSGFELVLSGLPESISRCDLDLYTESRDGVLRPIKDKSCP